MSQETHEDPESLRQRERQNTELLQAKAPDQFRLDQPTNPLQLLSDIGITPRVSRPNGYIRFTPADFIVEEVRDDGELAAIEPAATSPELDPEFLTQYVELVKIGQSTLEAIQHITHQLNIPLQKITYAGIKDARAITSQQIAIRGTTPDNITDQEFTHAFLKPIRSGKGILSFGQLKGNRFTIVVRTEKTAEDKLIQENVNTLKENGFANFYGVQRFGNRLLNPKLGQLLCQGKYEEAIKLYLTKQNHYEIPIHNTIRAKAAQQWPNWREMYQTFDILPYKFRYERTFVQSLMHSDNDWLAALNSLTDQIRFWVYGYAGYLINQVLSEAVNGTHDIPDPLPIPLGDSWSDEYYQHYLERDGTTDYLKHLNKLTFYNKKTKVLKPWIMPDIHGSKTLEHAVVLSFTLPTGAYATTFLMNIFNIYERDPIPTWVKTDQIDAKAELNTGSAQAALDALNFTDEQTHVWAKK